VGIAGKEGSQNGKAMTNRKRRVGKEKQERKAEGLGKQVENAESQDTVGKAKRDRYGGRENRLAEYTE
jgi:hypothetical protein